MGWTYYNTITPVNRKEECRAYFRTNGERYKILKDAMIGTTWYAAIKDQKTNEVFAAIFLTRVQGHEFGYKDMDETCGPVETDCPISILKLLTPTNSQYALEWREACRNKIKSEKIINQILKDAAYGSILKAVLYNGKEYLVVKRQASHQFKTDWLQILNENKYVRKTNIRTLSTT